MGELNPSGATATTTMHHAKTVTAVFARSTLHVNKEGEGTVSVSPPGGVQTLPFSETYAYDSDVTLFAASKTKWIFSGWSGDVPAGKAHDNPLALELNSNKSISAEFEQVTVTLSAENGLTECMEGRVVTYTATASSNFPVSGSNQATFTFYFRNAGGTYWSQSVISGQRTAIAFAEASSVPAGDADHMFSTPVMVEVVSGDGTAQAQSENLWIDVYELWIEHFRDAGTGADWKVVVGENIAFSAIASSDCANWVWDMPEGIPDQWNPTGGSSKGGTGMVIPTSDMPEAEDWNHFGPAYGEVTVRCTDGDGNNHSFSSHNMNPSRDASVYFDPGGTVHPPDDQSGVWTSYGTFPTKNWFYYWRAALIPNVPEVYYGVDPAKFPGHYTPYYENGPVVVTDVLNLNFAAPYNHFNDALQHRFTQQQVAIAGSRGYIVTRPTMEGKNGIDFFYSVVTHELKHRSDYEAGIGFPDGDGDALSDNVDPAPGIINGMMVMEYYDWSGYDWVGDTNKPIPWGAPTGDKEYSARQVEGVTAPASKDWSKGGKQW